VLKSLVASEKPDTFFELILDCAPPSDSDRHPNGNAGDAEEHADESKRVVCEERQQLWKPAVSLVLDEDSVGNFRADSLESFKDSWRPIKILEASGGVATDQLVSMLRPLSKSRISIMNISTFNEDFLLCDDERTDEVVHSISTAIRGEPDQPPLPLSPNSLRDIHDGAFVLLMPHRFVLLHHPADAMPEFAPSIMQVLLACADGDVDHGFVSVTRIAEEVSWIMPRELFHKFEASALVSPPPHPASTHALHRSTRCTPQLTVPQGVQLIQSRHPPLRASWQRVGLASVLMPPCAAAAGDLYRGLPRAAAARNLLRTLQRRRRLFLRAPCRRRVRGVEHVQLLDEHDAGEGRGCGGRG